MISSVTIHLRESDDHTLAGTLTLRRLRVSPL